MAYCTVQEVAEALHDPRKATSETAFIQACIDATVVEMDHAMNRIDPVPANDPLANRVNVLRAVEWYKANDAAFGVIGADETGGALQAPRDGFRRHVMALTPLKQRWGIA